MPRSRCPARLWACLWSMAEHRTVVHTLAILVAMADVVKGPGLPIGSLCKGSVDLPGGAAAS